MILAAQEPLSPFRPRLLVRLRLHLSRLPHLCCPLPLSQPWLSLLQLTLAPATLLWREGKVWSSSWLNCVSRKESRTAPGGAKLPAWKASKDSASPTWPLCPSEALPCAVLPVPAALLAPRDTGLQRGHWQQLDEVPTVEAEEAVVVGDVAS